MAAEAAAAVADAPARPPAPGAKPAGDEYFTRLVKLVPSEIVALYLTFKEVAAAFLDVWALICLVLLIIVRAWGTQESGVPVQKVAVVIAAVSFVLWVYATGGHFPWVRMPDVPGAISVAIGVWTFLIPRFYKGD